MTDPAVVDDAEGDAEGEETAPEGGDHKGKPVALVAPIVPEDKADDRVGDRVKSAGNKTASDPHDDDAHGSSNEDIAFFLPRFESVLSTGRLTDVRVLDPLSPEKVPRTVTASDYRKE